MSDRFTALGFDPAPGDVAAVDALCSAVQRTLQALVQIRSTLHSFGDPGSVWRGEAARAFAGELTELSPYLEQAEQSHEAAHRALTCWADDLHRRQLAARALADQAEAAQRSLLVAGQAAERTAVRVRTALAAGADAAAFQTAASAAAQRLDAAEQELANLRDRARRLREEHRVEAARVASAVRAAADVAPVEPGTFERIGSFLITTATSPLRLDDLVAELCRDNAHLLGELADVLADAAAVAGALALFVPAAAPIAVGLAAATLVVRAVSDASGAEVSASTYLFDGLSLGAGVVGRVASRGAQAGASPAARSASSGQAGGVTWGKHGRAHYERLEQKAGATGATGSVASTGTGVLQNSGDDRPFLHFVPDSKVEAAAAVALGPAAVGLVSAVDLGIQKDRKAAAQAERDRWNR